jgi:hypothetical protein
MTSVHEVVHDRSFPPVEATCLLIMPPHITTEFTERSEVSPLLFGKDINDHPQHPQRGWK